MILSRDRKSNEGLRRVWWYCCKYENIDARNPTRLPLLFALDAKLNIANGFVYHPRCEELRKGGSAVVYCGGGDGGGRRRGIGSGGSCERRWWLRWWWWRRSMHGVLLRPGGSEAMRTAGLTT